MPVRGLTTLLACLSILACDGKNRGAQPTGAPVSPAHGDAAPTPDPTPAPQPDPAAKPATPDGRDFIDEARFLYRAAACGGSEPVAAPIPQEAIDSHCKKLKVDVDKYRERWLARAAPFFAEHVPRDLPDTVVYPFAGADLLTALAVFPDFAEATTLSLEPAGDPRTVKTMKAGAFRGALNGVRSQLHNLLVMNHNLTLKMITHFRGGGLPGHLIFTLKALEIHGLVPVSVHFFDLKPDGSIDYLTAAEIAAFPDNEGVTARNARFGNVEVRFSKPGDKRVRIYRHILANLDDEHLAAEPAALAHLEAKGKVAMITKAASFLLWYGTFSTIRDYMLENMAWMVSDATGIPPGIAEKAGFELITYGRFNGPILEPPKKVAGEWVRFWRSQKRRPLDFRFGYPDNNKGHHLVITRPKTAASP